MLQKTHVLCLLGVALINIMVKYRTIMKTATSVYEQPWLELVIMYDHRHIIRNNDMRAGNEFNQWDVESLFFSQSCP